MIEGIIFACFMLPMVTMGSMDVRSEHNLIIDICSQLWNCIVYLIYIGMLLSCFICHIVYFVRVSKNDISGYNCSDDITNEIIRKGIEDSTRNIIYIKVNFYLELALFVGNVLAVIINIIMDKCKGNSVVENDKSENNKINNDINEKAETKNNENNEIPLVTYSIPTYPTPN